MNVTRRSNAARILSAHKCAGAVRGMTEPEARKEEICITIR